MAAQLDLTMMERYTFVFGGVSRKSRYMGAQPGRTPENPWHAFLYNQDAETTAIASIQESNLVQQGTTVSANDESHVKPVIFSAKGKTSAREKHARLSQLVGVED